MNMRFFIIAAAATLLAAVSYTHLDVYKRQELLSRSTSLTVIKPASLRRRVAEIYEKALHRNMDK